MHCIHLHFAPDPSFAGGLAYPDDAAIKATAAECIRLFDIHPFATGARHMQSQRFLNKDFSGLRGNAGDLALRPIMESLANGSTCVGDLLASNDPRAISFVQWTSAFRLVLWHAFSVCETMCSRGVTV